MPYRVLATDATVEDGLRRIAREQVDKAIAEIDDANLDRHETVHQLRKRCKKLRGLIRLVRGVFPDYRAENVRFRDTNRSLSGLRDTQALIEAYDALMARHSDEVDRQATGAIRRRLTLQRKQAAESAAALESTLAAVRKEMTAARKRAGRWRLEGDGFAALEGGLKLSYRRARVAMADAQRAGTPRQFHEWRKRVKYHWYHMRLLQEIWPAEAAAREAESDRLGELLGDDHDLAVFRQRLLDDPHAFGDLATVQGFVELIDRRRSELQTEARALGARLLAEKPGALARRLEAYWEVWREETAEQPAPRRAAASGQAA